VENILELKNKIIEIVDNNHEKTNGSCGIYFKQILKELNITYDFLQLLVSELYNEEKIDIRLGIHGNMLFSIKKPKTQWTKPELKSEVIFPKLQ